MKRVSCGVFFSGNLTVTLACSSLVKLKFFIKMLFIFYTKNHKEKLLNGLKRYFCGLSNLCRERVMDYK